jgi:hypothetical protein
VVFPVPPVSSTNKIYYNDIAEILLKMELNTINQTQPIKHNKQMNYVDVSFYRVNFENESIASNGYWQKRDKSWQQLRKNWP